MNTIPKRKPTNKLIAMVLAITMTCVYVVGDNYAPIVAEKSKLKSTDLLTQTLDYSTDLFPNTELKDVSELVLAENTTYMGKASQSLVEAFANMPENVESSEELEKSVADFSKQISDLKARTTEELSDTDDGSADFSEYRDTVISGYNDLEELLSNVTVENYETVMADISALINPEKPYVSLADDLPFNDVSDDNITYSTYNPESVTDYQIEDSNYSNDDLHQTNDTIINDDVRAEFADLESVLEVYQYIKNNYLMEFYFGSRKGAIGASAEKAGNDYDIASLLIGVLRDRNIPARYATGEIEITAKQAMEWTATDDINVAIRSIAALGIPTTGMISDGETVAVRLEHTWVEAYVPYTDYRGTGNRSGERLWIPLDASFKKSIHNDGVDLSGIQDYISDPNNQVTDTTELNGVNIGDLNDILDSDHSAFVKYLLENGYGEATLAETFGGKSIVTTDLGYLPLSLPYQNTGDVERLNDIPDADTDSVTFRLYGNSAIENDFSGSDSIKYTYLAPDVYGKRIVLSYVPATQADQDVINEYGNIFSTPAYLVKMKPQLVIDGEVVAEGNVCNAGYMQQYAITVHNGAASNNDSIISNNIEVGGMYCIAMDYGNISANELQNAAEYMDSKKNSTSEENIYTEEIMGGMLNSVAKIYFAQLDQYNTVLAGQKNVTATRALSLGIVGFKVNVQYTFNRPSELNEGGIFLDIGHDVHSVISNTNTDKDEKAYMLQAGIYASAMEHGVLEQVTGIESVSTIKTLQYAQEHNIPIHTIVKENLNEELNTISVSANVKQEIRSAVNSGKTVIIPEREITINQWSGVGYMVLDPDTFACGYMISGGLAGGSMTASQMIGEYVSAVIQGAISMILWEVFKTVALAMCPCGWVSVIGFLINFTEFVMMLDCALQMIELWNMYQATGEIYYLQELGIQVAAFATLSIASKLFGNKINELKEKINSAVNEAGLAGKCFVAGTLISTTMGLIPIEKITTNTMVYSFDPDTLEVSEKQVEDVFVKESSKLIDIEVNGETIKTTPDHPFYVPQKGFTRAIELRAGDELYTVNGEYVVIEKIQHVILESPVKVYNFRVADYHTYYVGNNSIGTHNLTCESSGSIDDFLKGKKSFEEVKGDFAKAYADAVKSNKKWTWADDVPGSERLSGGQKTAIRKLAIEQGLLPNIKVTKVNGQKYGFADFEGAGVVERTEFLPEEYWLKSDEVQFNYLNKLIGGEMEGYTWHHTETPGKMQLIPTGIHNMVTHNGGCSPGMWSYYPGRR
ncbi:polymorphic toxin-type HINT domain-containing protein [Ruminococcus sp.]|uniref:polymorphic toxin-type HINT domain-containing protein n=1 Tax=Ruminococcus sp. TaxID=41978 RepID=UPI00258285DE|nr:polymorphic toxin-type HINT domain-containing protein [Ruminococcus sp.]MCR5022697.1 HNH endonuclease [Ruminococcus sp.]